MLITGKFSEEAGDLQQPVNDYDSFVTKQLCALLMAFVEDGRKNYFVSSKTFVTKPLDLFW